MFPIRSQFLCHIFFILLYQQTKYLSKQAKKREDEREIKKGVCFIRYKKEVLEEDVGLEYVHL